LLTLKQLAGGSTDYLPQCEIKDWPSFENRGIMLDVSRSKVPTLDTLFNLIDQFANWKINQLQLYIEHVFAYHGHETVWRDASPFTQSDFQKLDTYCDERFIELVPNLNCFGHMHRWLVHDDYRPLAECPNGGETGLGYRKEPQGLCPLDPGSIELAKDLIHQMVSCFKSNQVNVGCDETIDLGYGRSKKSVEQKGRGRVYLEYLLKIQEICKEAGYSMQFWADILLKYPELISEIPDGCTALNWGYEANHPFEKETLSLKQSGKPFYVCPGTSSWNSIGGRTANMMENIRNAAEQGEKHRAVGFMTTDWGDNGHWQPLLASYPGFVYGARMAWSNCEGHTLETLLDQFVFHAEGWGKLLLDIGNVDKQMGITIHNRSILFNLLQDEDKTLRDRQDLEVVKLSTTLARIEKLQSAKNALDPAKPIDGLLEQEFSWVIKMLIHACRRGLQILEDMHSDSIIINAIALREQHKTIWHARNRPGGYEESRALFDALIKR
ncbi:MAG: beta-N-acetylhexosaminidase, partial [Verrucomicrobia bacterium]|nr:beta-N-acetylhexosaminidase [Verrucomicrobiota bacterium]